MGGKRFVNDPLTQHPRASEIHVNYLPQVMQPSRSEKLLFPRPSNAFAEPNPMTRALASARVNSNGRPSSKQPVKP